MIFMGLPAMESLSPVKLLSGISLVPASRSIGTIEAVYFAAT
jgi:hypothetical protein